MLIPENGAGLALRANQRIQLGILSWKCHSLKQEGAPTSVLRSIAAAK
jgi:hypothetical protein